MEFCRERYPELLESTEYQSEYSVYSVSLFSLLLDRVRATARERTEPAWLRRAALDSVRWLLAHQTEPGAYGYPGGAAGEHVEDVSNSMYALLALGAAADDMAEELPIVPAIRRATTRLMGKMKATKGIPGAGFPYWLAGATGRDARGSSTAAGALCLHVGVGHVDSQHAVDVRRALESATAWLSDQHALAWNPPGVPRDADRSVSGSRSNRWMEIPYHFSYLHAMASIDELQTRIGGGDHVWRAGIFEYLIGTQRSDGSWASFEAEHAGDEGSLKEVSARKRLVDTALALLTLKGTVASQLRTPVTTGPSER
jgi:hypothetical protein